MALEGVEASTARMTLFFHLRASSPNGKQTQLVKLVYLSGLASALAGIVRFPQHPSIQSRQGSRSAIR